MDQHNIHRDSLAGQILEKFPELAGAFLPLPSPSYLFSKPINWLDFNPDYPKEPKTIGDYIRKWRMEQGIFQAGLGKTLGVDEMTIINWEKGRTRPGKRCVERLKEILQDVTVDSLG